MAKRSKRHVPILTGCVAIATSSGPRPSLASTTAHPGGWRTAPSSPPPVRSRKPATSRMRGTR